MKDFQRSMKLSLTYGLWGAVVLPLLYECYANISRTGALVLIAAWAVFVGAKLSPLDIKAALLAAAAGLAYTAGLGFIVFVLIHPPLVRWLEKNSKYFYLTLQEQGAFIGYAFALMLLSFVTVLGVWGVRSAIRRIKNNNAMAASYIENAFDSEDGDK
ncbi:MAG: hypothetical protein IJ746_02310 [Ruminococcus sp.]|nr:hypothetical protein [Ruminococcus sp.]